MEATAKRRLVRVEVDGQVTLPADVRGKLGLKRGHLVSVVETEDGLLLTSETLIAARDIDRTEAELRAQGLSLDELIDSGRQIRGDLIKEQYGLDGRRPRRDPARKSGELPCRGAISSATVLTLWT